jgi:hypothetical protein
MLDLTYVMQVVSNIAAAHSKGSSVKLVSMDEVCRWLPAVKQRHAEDLAVLAEWCLSHSNWVPPPPEAQVNSICACHTWEVSDQCVLLRTTPFALQEAAAADGKDNGNNKRPSSSKK